MSRRPLASILLLLTLVAIGSITSGCQSTAGQNRAFARPLPGYLIFQDLSGGFYKIDLAKSSEEVLPLDALEIDSAARSEDLKLDFVRDQDTNADGQIDYEDLADVLVMRDGSGGWEKVDMGYRVRYCSAGSDSEFIACSFSKQDIFPDCNSLGGVIFLVELETGELVSQLSESGESSWLPTWSPDGTMLAFETAIESDTGWESVGIRIVKVPSGDLVYTILEPSSSEPVWSPDSTKIAFTASLDPGEYSEMVVENMYHDVFYLDLNDPSHTFHNVTRTRRFSSIPASLTELGGIWVMNPMWSPDGNAIASVWHQDGEAQIWVHSVLGDEFAQLTRKSVQSYYLMRWDVEPE